MGATSLALCPVVLAQTQVLVATGDVLPGLGTVASIQDVDFNDADEWVVTVRTDQTPGFQSIMIRDGAIVFQPGDPLPASPPYDSFLGARTPMIDEQGGLSWLQGHPTSSVDNAEAAYSDSTPIGVRNTPLVAPGIAPGTEFEYFHNLVAEPGGTFLVHALADDPNDGLFPGHVLLRSQAQPGGGFGHTVLLQRGDFLPGVAEPFQELSEFSYGLDSNSSGEVIYTAFFSSLDQGVYLDQVPLALRGEPSAVFGENWSSFYRMPVALNDAGDYAFGGYTTGSGIAQEAVLVWNGVKMIQEGESLPDIAPFQFTALQADGICPLHLSDDGRVFWFGEWDDPDTARDAGIFMDHELVVSEGGTWVDGVPVVDLLNTSVGIPKPKFQVNSDGSALVFRAQLADGREGAFLVHPKGTAEVVQGCLQNAGVLNPFVPPKLGTEWALTMEAPQAPDALGFLFFSSGLFPGVAPCGFSATAGELMIDVTPPNPFLAVPSPALLSGVAFFLFPAIPDDLALFGFRFYGQGLWVDFAGQAPGETFRLTNAVELGIGQ